MRKAVTLAAAGAAAAAIAIGGATSASATTPSKKLNKNDISFLRSNDQTNLTEIRLGTYIVNHAKDQNAVGLARMTRHDHKLAEARVRTLAKNLNLSIPNSINSQQKAVRNYIQSHKRKDLYYFLAQVAGHKQSIAATKYEIAHGHDHLVKVYAKNYLPVAQAHLRMANRDLANYEKTHGGGHRG